MSLIERMLSHSPVALPADRAQLAACINACFECAQACTACADACLGEAEVEPLRHCIRLNLDCADICLATGRAISRQTAFDPVVARALVGACATACKQCGDECARHATHGMAHCHICAEACQHCQEACIELVVALAA